VHKNRSISIPSLRRLHMTNPQKSIFISDFDGTIISQDIAEKILCDTKGEKIMKELSYKINNGTIDIKYFMDEVCECISQNSENYLGWIDRLIEKYDIKFDHSFKQLVELCSQNSTEIYILSGGLKKIIEHILKKNNITFKTENIISHDFEHCNEKVKFKINPELCTKGKYIKTHFSGRYNIIFAGDGYSDYTAVKYCDNLFVKNNSILEEYCRQHIINNTIFSNFLDVQENLIEQNILIL